MAAKGKSEAPPEDDEDKASDGEAAAEAAPKKAGLVGKILGPVMGLLRFANPLAILKLPMKMKLIVGGGLIVVLAGAGAGAYFLMGSAAPGPEAEAESVKTQAPNLPSAEAAFFDIPDIIVNIQTPDAAPAYLKLSVDGRAHV